MLQYLVKKYPDNEWDWPLLCEKLPLNMIRSLENEEWYWNKVSQNPHITMEYVVEYAKKHSSDYVNVFERLFTYKSRLDMIHLSDNSAITLKDIIDHPEFEWRYFIYCNPNITMDDVLELPELPEPNYKWFSISRNPNLTLKFVLDHRNKVNDYLQLSRKVPLQDVKDHPEFRWYFSGLSENPNITMEFIIDNIEKPWNWYLLSINMNIKDIIDYPECPWQSEGISQNPSVTIEYVLNHKECRWNWVSLIENIPLQDILDHPEFPWPLQDISCNRSITLDFISENVEKKVENSGENIIDFYELSFNDFKFDKDLGKKVKNTKYNLEMLKLPFHLVRYI